MPFSSFGGKGHNGLFNDTWMFSFADSNWTELNPETIPAARLSAAMEFNEFNHLFYMFAGEGDKGFLSDSWTFDMTYASWDQLSPATSPSNREGSSMAFDPIQGAFLLFGGKDERYLNDTWKFDPKSLNWIYLTPSAPPHARAFASMAFDDTRNVFILFGGKT